MASTANDKASYTIKVSSQGQLTLPAVLRRQMNIKSGDELIISTADDSKLELEKKPSASEWERLIDGLPTERVYLKSDGTVDEIKSPHFAKRMG